MNTFIECKLLAVAKCWLLNAAGPREIPGECPPATVPWESPGPGDCDRLLDLARKNRMSPLLAVAPDHVLGGAWSIVRSRVDEDYKAALLESLGRLSAGVACCKAVEAAGVPVVGLRGAFDAVRWRGDAALGLSADVDLLVPAAFRCRALRALEGEGWRRRGRGPAWVDAVNHYHWTLVRADWPVACDLHWAMHHRYRLHAVDYAAICGRAVCCESTSGPWRGPTAEDAFLLACLRMERETPSFWKWPDPDGLFGLVRRGEMRRWFDAAAIVHRNTDRFDWSAVVRRAEAWNMADEVAVTVTWLEFAFALSLPDEVRDWAQDRCIYRASHGLTATCWWRTVSVRPEWDGVFAKVALPYLWPTDTQLGCRKGVALAASRVGHVVRASARLVGGAAVAAVGAIAGSCRQGSAAGVRSC